MNLIAGYRAGANAHRFSMAGPRVWRVASLMLCLGLPAAVGSGDRRITKESVDANTKRLLETVRARARSLRPRPRAFASPPACPTPPVPDPNERRRWRCST